MNWSEFARHIKYLPPASQKLVRKAFDLGKKYHEGQERKSGEPYFTHPIRVAEMLAAMEADDETIVVALLHDAVEDTPLTIEEVGKLFGPSIQRLIDGLTKLAKQDIAEKPTVNEQTETLRKIFTLMEQDVRIMIIKLVDRLHNMQTVSFLPPEKQVAIARETQDIYVKFAGKLCMQELSDELEALCLAILEPEAYQKLLSLRQEIEERAGNVLARMTRGLRDQVKGVPLTIVHEPQTWDRLRDQLHLRSLGTNVPLQHSVAFVTNSIDQCYSILGHLHQRWQWEVVSFQDFINSPVMNGYRGLHTTIILRDGTRVRCKIRTEEMHAYARRGVTNYCFDKKALGHLEYLPWMQRIAPLAEDTKERSQEFWDSLQSDILGDSMIVYGATGRAVSLPAGSTALDAAFHILQDEALNVNSVRVNGEPVHLRYPVKHGDSLDFKTQDPPAVAREWLKWVHTSFATAKIRHALSSLQSESEKLATGKTMLQRVLDERQRGFIEEFNEDALRTGLQAIGYSSLNDVYIAIADGHLDPLDAYAAVFSTGEKGGRKRLYNVQFEIDQGNEEMLEYLRDVQRESEGFREIRSRYLPMRQRVRISLRLFIPSQEYGSLLTQLQLRGARQIRSRQASSLAQYSVGILALIFLWGFDPVIAKFLINNGLDPLYFSLIRNWSTLVFAALIYLLSPRYREPFSPIPFRDRWLWTAGVSLFLVSLASYLALSQTTPSVYNSTIRATSLLLALPLLLRGRQPEKLGLAWIATIAGFVLLAYVAGSTMGFLLSLLVLFLFAAYTFASTQFQRENYIYARYYQYFFYTCVISAISSLSLLPLLRDTPSPTSELVLAAVLFSVLFVGIPYILFYHLIPQVGYPLLSRSINTGALLTVIAQGFVFGWGGFAFTLIGTLCLITGNLLSTLSQEREKRAIAR